MAKQRRLENRLPFNRMFAKERIGLLKLPQGFVNCADNGINIFMREKLEINADSAPKWHAEWNVCIQSIGFNGEDLHRRGIGDGLICAAPSFAATTFYPTINPPQESARGIAGLTTGDDEK